MSEELGKIERLPVEVFKESRKLCFVPLVFVPRDPPAELVDRVDKYWEQVEAHVGNLEGKLGKARHVYHELVPLVGEDGAKAVQELNKGSAGIMAARLEGGAELEPLEDPETLAEYVDWGRCLAAGLQSRTAFDKVYGFYVDAQKRRAEHMARQIDATLKEGETGILLMAEGNRVQFPSDIQVFYVAPPALDEIKRWVREHAPEG